MKTFERLCTTYAPYHQGIIYSLVSIPTDEFEALGDNQNLVCMALSPRFGSLFALGSSQGSICIYTVGSTEPLLTLQPPTGVGKLSSISFDVCEELLLAIYNSGDICVWQLDSELLVRNWRVSGPLNAAIIHPAGTLVSVLRSEENQIELWDLHKRCLMHIYAIPAQFTLASTLSYSPDGLHLVCGAAERGKGAVALIFDLQRGLLAHTLCDPTDTNAHICTLAFHPEEALLAAGSSTGKITIFDFVRYEPVQIVSANARVQQLTFNPEGTCLMALTASNVNLWQIHSSTSIQLLETLFIDGTSSTCTQLAFGFNSYAILASVHQRNVTTWYYNLQASGLYSSNLEIPCLEQKIEEKADANQVESDMPDDEDLMQQITNNKLMYTLRNRLDHLRALRSIWSVKNTGLSVLQALAKQPSATRPELLGELISARIVELTLNISPSTVGPNGLVSPTSEQELVLFLTLLKQHLRHMSEAHQLKSLTYLSQLASDLALVCPEKFEEIKQELQRIVESLPAESTISVKSKEVLSNLSGLP